MSELQSPLKDLLRGATTPASIARMWQRIEARTRIGRSSSPRIARHKSIAWLAAAAVLLTMAVAAASRMHRQRRWVRSPAEAIFEGRRTTNGASHGHLNGAAKAAAPVAQEQKPMASAP